MTAEDLRSGDTGCCEVWIQVAVKRIEVWDDKGWGTGWKWRHNSY